MRELYGRKFPGRTPGRAGANPPKAAANATPAPVAAEADLSPDESTEDRGNEAAETPPRNLYREAEDEFERAFMAGKIDPEVASDIERGIERDAPVSAGEIAEENSRMLRRRDTLRRAAELVAAEMAKLPEVETVVLFGSVAAPPTKDVPRHGRLRRDGIKIWRECKDVDLAVWISNLARLKALKQAVSYGVNLCQAEAALHNWSGVPHHQIDVFILEPGSDRYRGRLCFFGQCPKGKPECEVPGCGAQLFLQQYEGFRFDRAGLHREWVVTLFERPTPPDDVPF